MQVPKGTHPQDEALPPPIVHLHSNGEFCQDRPLGYVPDIWPVNFYSERQVREAQRAALAAAAGQVEQRNQEIMRLAEAMCAGGSTRNADKVKQARIELRALLATAPQPPQAEPRDGEVVSQHMVDRLFKAIEHGDQAHRLWLRQALDAFFRGWPVPAPRSASQAEPRGELTDEAITRCLQATVCEGENVGFYLNLAFEKDSGQVAMIMAREIVRVIVGAALQQEAGVREKLEAFDNTLSSWARAYPLTVFPEPDLGKVAEVLKAAGLTIDAVSASNMRHVVTKLNEEFEPVRAMLAASPDGQGEG